MRGFLLIAVLVCMALAACAQDASPGAKPSTTSSPGTAASSGAPTIANPPPGPAQPIAFSHKQHINKAKASCNDCHEPSRNGTTLVMPQATKCMSCHATIAPDKPDIKRIADAAQNNQILQWVRVYSVPSFVTFSHKTHTSSGAQCEDCHGPVAEREAITREKDISMGGCISCHTQKSAPTGCDTCHQLNSMQLHFSTAAPDAALFVNLTQTNRARIGTSMHRLFAVLSVPQSSNADIRPRPFIGNHPHDSKELLQEGSAHL